MTAPSCYWHHTEGVHSQKPHHHTDRQADGSMIRQRVHAGLKRAVTQGKHVSEWVGEVSDGFAQLFLLWRVQRRLQCCGWHYEPLCTAAGAPGNPHLPALHHR